MNPYEWIKEFPASITVSDAKGVVIDMNDQAEANLQDEGGRNLIGKNMLDCHPEPARAKLEQMLAGGMKNVYTIEKKGIKKLIFQSPWYMDGRYAGFVEMAMEIPAELPHFIRS